MELLRYNPNGNATWPPIALLQIAFCTWVPVHLWCIFWYWGFSSTQYHTAFNNVRETITLKHANNNSQHAYTGFFHPNGQTFIQGNTFIWKHSVLLSKHLWFYGLLHRTNIIFGKHPSVDNVSETSVTDETMSESATVNVPRVRRINPNLCHSVQVQQFKSWTADCDLIKENYRES